MTASGCKRRMCARAQGGCKPCKPRQRAGPQQPRGARSAQPAGGQVHRARARQPAEQRRHPLVVAFTASAVMLRCFLQVGAAGRASAASPRLTGAARGGVWGRTVRQGPRAQLETLGWSRCAAAPPARPTEAPAVRACAGPWAAPLSQSSCYDVFAVAACAPAAQAPGGRWLQRQLAAQAAAAAGWVPGVERPAVGAPWGCPPSAAAGRQARPPARCSPHGRAGKGLRLWSAAAFCNDTYY